MSPNFFGLSSKRPKFQWRLDNVFSNARLGNIWFFLVFVGKLLSRFLKKEPFIMGEGCPCGSG